MSRSVSFFTLSNEGREMPFIGGDNSGQQVDIASPSPSPSPVLPFALSPYPLPFLVPLPLSSSRPPAPLPFPCFCTLSLSPNPFPYSPPFPCPLLPTPCPLSLAFVGFRLNMGPRETAADCQFSGIPTRGIFKIFRYTLFMAFIFFFISSFIPSIFHFN